MPSQVFGQHQPPFVHCGLAFIFTLREQVSEVLEVNDCIRQKKEESEIMPLDETLTVLSILDEIRNQWGLKYPME